MSSRFRALVEDPGTRRVLDQQGDPYRHGVTAANRIIDEEPLTLPVQVLEAEMLTAELLRNGPDDIPDWGMYVVLKGFLDTAREHEEATRD
jgi:hypothetical protein